MMVRAINITEALKSNKPANQKSCTQVDKQENSNRQIYIVIKAT